MQYQQTLKRPAICAGPGVHKGVKSRLLLKPAPSDQGLCFIRTDIRDRPNQIMAASRSVSDTRLGTTLTNAAGVSVAVVEHLLAACAGLGVDNLTIEIDGPEVPIMDGSSALYCDLMLEAGLQTQAGLRRRIRILEPIEIRDGRKSASLLPSADDFLTMRARIEFDNPVIGVQQMALRLTPGAFARDLAFARTFGFAADVERLKTMGLARGGSLDNAVVLDGDAIMNPEGLRCSDEFVRHKALDAIGDLSLAGGPIAGIYDVVQPGHGLNNALVRKLLDTPEAWCWECDSMAGEDIAYAAAARL